VWARSENPAADELFLYETFRDRLTNKIRPTNCGGGVERLGYVYVVEVGDGLFYVGRTERKSPEERFRARGVLQQVEERCAQALKRAGRGSVRFQEVITTSRAHADELEIQIARDAIWNESAGRGSSAMMVRRLPSLPVPEFELEEAPGLWALASLMI